MITDFNTNQFYFLYTNLVQGIQKWYFYYAFVVCIVFCVWFQKDLSCNSNNVIVLAYKRFHFEKSYQDLKNKYIVVLDINSIRFSGLFLLQLHLLMLLVIFFTNIDIYLGSFTNLWFWTKIEFSNGVKWRWQSWGAASSARSLWQSHGVDSLELSFQNFLAFLYLEDK